VRVGFFTIPAPAFLFGIYAANMVLPFLEKLIIPSRAVKRQPCIFSVPRLII